MMLRCAVFFSVLFAAVVLQPLAADAQLYCHHRGFGMAGYRSMVATPVVGPAYAFYEPNPYYPQPLPIYHSSAYLRRLYSTTQWQNPIWQDQVVPAAFIPSANMPAIQLASLDPIKAPAVPSSDAAQLKSIKLQFKGDQRLREQKWSDARAAYSSAVSAAPDRAESHLRLALCYVAISRYDAAIKQMKRALFLDPTLPKTGSKLIEIFGPDSKVVLNSIISKLSDWVNEDPIDSDRLFLLGVVLHFNDDPRANQFLDAAGRLRKGVDATHVALFMKPGAPAPADANANQAAPDPMPKLNPMPNIPKVVPPKQDFRFPRPQKPVTPVPAPVPMPDGE
jgi:tetratricopeptide (TPR) repeat protein